RPPDVLPSPPPCGWSTGFIATPRTVGRLPFQRIRPALPQLMLDCSALPTSPTAGRQLDGVHDGADRNVAQRQGVTRLDVGGRAVLDAVALLQQPRREDVTL